MDTHFLNSVVLAGRAFKAVHDTDPTIEGAQLAKYLRSDRPLGHEERILLAELVTGEWRSPQGRKEVLPGQCKVKAVVAAYRAHLAGGCQKKEAKYLVAKQFEISNRTIEEYEKMTAEREVATKQEIDKYADK